MSRSDSKKQDKQSSQQDPQSWPELWEHLGKQTEEMLSVTQAKLAADAYPLECGPRAAVDDGKLTPVYRQGGGIHAETHRVLAGYQLAGHPRGDQQ